MADVTLYDSTGQTSNGVSSGASQGGFEAFSFSTGAASGTLADVQVDLRIQSPDNGSVTAYLYSSDNSGTTPVPGAPLATLGTISDASLPAASVTLSDFGGASNVSLAPNTRYWVKLVSTSNSQIEYQNAGGDGGTGAATEYQMGSGSVAGTSDSNASDGDSVQGLVTEATCFASGTLIRTTQGNVPVEDLVAGDVAVTASGRQRSIKWLGHRTIDCRNHPRPHGVMPIRFYAHALGPNRPSRDLFVSPGHAICVDVLSEVLIPAALLVNGSTIVQVEVDKITYWHVELDNHDIILAENMPAESYMDMGNRSFFAESVVVNIDASPDAPVATHADFCRPFVDGGPLLDAVKARLDKRAGELRGLAPRQGAAVA